MLDTRTVFETEIKPLAEEIRDLCSRLRIPMFAAFCVYDDEKETKYENFAAGSASQGIKLTRDEIIKHINVANGFDTKLPSHVPDFHEFANIEDKIGGGP